MDHRFKQNPLKTDMHEYEYPNDIAMHPANSYLQRHLIHTSQFFHFFTNSEGLIVFKMTAIVHCMKVNYLALTKVLRRQQCH